VCASAPLGIPYPSISHPPGGIPLGNNAGIGQAVCYHIATDSYVNLRVGHDLRPAYYLFTVENLRDKCRLGVVRYYC
jgi:hypothetical protein